MKHESRNTIHEIRIREFFDLYWKRKRLRRWDDMRHLARSLKDEAYSKVPIESPSKILEIGPGMGQDTKFLAREGREVYAIDISREGINRARDQIPNFNSQTPIKFQSPISNIKTNFHFPLTNLQFVQMDAHRMGFKEESFDLLFGNTVLMHLHRGKFFPEAHRVLKVGGRAVFIEPLRFNPFLLFYRFLLSESRKIRPRYLSPQEIPRLSSFFQNVRSRESHLLSIVFIPLLSTKSQFVFQLFFSMDEILLKLFPFLKGYCAFTVIECVK